ncbi:hypothetical protein F2Q68_00004587 [Brassica cretica]|uniref:Retrotransposon gag domain-containing protein n=1 Tax=Brassica cretica TaxID=69181 RepID=A0A8S9JNL3_BRACR|nr:hypothetical protein F2Q68_00004587 [Brassica cretica]
MENLGASDDVSETAEPGALVTSEEETGALEPRRLFTDPFPSLVPSWGIFQRLIAILLSVGMRGPTEFERAQDGGASEVSSFFGLCPSQLTPLTWRTLMAIQVLEELHGFSVGIHEILYSYYYAPLEKDAQTYDVEDSESEPEPDKEAPDGATKEESPMVAYLEQMFTKRLDAMQSMVERLPRVAPPIRKSSPDSYADTPFMDEVTLIEMPRKFSFPSIKAYDGTTDLDDHVAQYKQRMLAVVLPKGSRKATLCKRFGSTLTRPALQWYINLPSRSIASFAVLSDKFVEQFACSRDLEKTTDSLYEILQHRVEPLRGYLARFNQEKVAIPECSNPTAISAFKRGLLPDRDLYKELTKYQCKTMEDVLSRAWA